MSCTNNNHKNENCSRNNIFEEVAHVKIFFGILTLISEFKIFNRDSSKSIPSTLYCKDMETEVGWDPNSEMNL